MGPKRKEKPMSKKQKERLEKAEAEKTAWRDRESSFMTCCSRNKVIELSMRAKKETPGPDAYHKFKIKT